MGDIHWKTEEGKHDYWATTLKILQKELFSSRDTRVGFVLLSVANYLEEEEEVSLAETIKGWAKVVLYLISITTVVAILWWGQEVRIDRDAEHAAVMALIEDSAVIPITRLEKNSVDRADSGFNFNDCLKVCEHRADNE